MNINYKYLRIILIVIEKLNNPSKWRCSQNGDVVMKYYRICFKLETNLQCGVPSTN